MNALQALFGYLRPGRVIQENGGALQRRKLPADEIDICTKRR
jgi:hypothetical protein